MLWFASVKAFRDKKEGLGFTLVELLFDEHGVRLDSKMQYFDPDGAPVEAFHRRPDGTIIHSHV